MTNFWQALELVESQEEKNVEYRLYYYPDGSVKCYTMDDLDGDYIVVDKEVFNQCRYDLIVRDGVLSKPKVQLTWKVHPGSEDNKTGDEWNTCHKDNVTIIVDEDDPNSMIWSYRAIYDTD